MAHLLLRIGQCVRILVRGVDGDGDGARGDLRRLQLSFLIAAGRGGLLALLDRSFGRVDHDQNARGCCFRLLASAAVAELALSAALRLLGGGTLRRLLLLGGSLLLFCGTVVAGELELFDVGDLSL